MQLYFCRSEGDSRQYVARDNLGRYTEEVTYTIEFSKAYITPSKILAEQIVRAHKGIELCCIDGVCAVVPSEETRYGMNIPGADPTRLNLAIGKLISAIQDLERVRPVKFCNLDDNGTVLNFKGLSYSEEDDTIYVDLVYPAPEPGDVHGMKLE